MHHLEGAAVGRHRGFQAARGSGPESGKPKHKHLSIHAAKTAWIPYCIILKGQHSGATGDFKLPGVLAQNLVNLPKSALPLAQECRMAHLGTLANPVEPKCYHRLAGTTKGLQNVIQIRPESGTRSATKTCIQASKHPSLGSKRSAAEAVAFKLNNSYYMLNIKHYIISTQYYPFYIISHFLENHT